ncbi:MAG TPA: hypothetical protein EYG45_02200, partial [Candidatus Poseidoniales archaeon]|nr:hypothetical protein [Candidatus Poseidoniales archaeon]
MRRTAVLLVILMLTAIPASMSQDFRLAAIPSQMSTGSGANCPNQTHSGDAFYADGSTGNDSWNGTQDCPTASIQAAVDLASENGTVIVREGVYHEVVTLDQQGMRLRVADGERVILDGSRSVTGNLGGSWSVHDSSSTEGIVWKADLTQDAWQLFVDYEEEMPARWPNANFSDGTALDDDEYWAHGSVNVDDYETNETAACNEGMSKYQSGNKYYCLNYLNGELEDDNSSYAGHNGLIDSGVNATDAIAVLNIGSFRTWSRNVTSHNTSNGSFNFEEVPSDEWKYKHHMYFLTQKLELLDVPGEWFFDHESSANTVYYMPRDGSDPNDLDIRMKTQPYAILCSDDDGVVVEGFDYFATTFSLDDCDGSEIRNSTLLYPSTSKRSLGHAGEDMDNRYVSRFDDCISCLVDSCDFLYTDGAAFEAHGGASSSQNNTINNSYFYHIDWSGSDQKSLMTTIMMDGTTNRFTNNTMHRTGTSATIRIGNAPQIMFNEIYDTAHIQSDGTVVQMMQAEQENATVAYNWIHDVPKYGIRMDGPFGGTNSGRNASVHHNVLWNVNGAIVVKGDYHNVSNNTVLLGSEGDRNHIIVLYDSTGGNENSTIMSNAANSISGHRTNSNLTDPIPVNSTAIGNNWNGYDPQNTGENVSGMLVSPETSDFRPVFGSEIGQMGAGAYSSTQNATVPADPSSFDPSTYYWLPGIKRNVSSPYQRTSFDLPCPSGQYRSAAGASCEAAPAGQHVPLWGSNSPTECTTGTWQDETGQSSCIEADAGNYVGTNGSMIQIQCSTGSWQDQPGQASCMNASAGYYVDTNESATQNQCSPGTFQPLAGQTSCIEADAGHYVAQAPLEFTSISGKWGHTCGIMVDGTLYCWGDGDSGQIGDGGLDDRSYAVAVDLPPGRAAISVSAGYAHSCAVLDNLSAYCWGMGGWGQMGHGSWDSNLVPGPVSLPSNKTVSSVVAGYDHSCALMNDSSLYCWGKNAVGQLGNGDATVTHSFSPILIIGSSVEFVSAGNQQTCAILSNGTAYCWGRNDYGSLGNIEQGWNDDSYEPLQVDVPPGREVTVISAGTSLHSCATLDNGSAYCWGYGNDGQLGNASSYDTTNCAGYWCTSGPTPVQVLLPQGSNATSIKTGGSHSCATLSNYSLYCWGHNWYGEVGDGTQSSRLVPVLASIVPEGGISDFSAGGGYSCVVTHDDSAFCWGDGSLMGNGRLGIGEINATNHLNLDPLLEVRGPYVPFISQTACSLGSYQSSTGQSSCDEADAGHFVSTNGSATQTPCELGTWNNMTGQVSCTNASVGHYVDTNGSATQTPCGLGTWNNMTGQVSCTNASVGHYVDTNGSATQTPCGLGTWNNMTG